MGFLSGDNDKSPAGKYHQSTFGDKVKDDRWSPDDWDADDGDGKAPWERKGKSGGWSE